MKDVNKTTSRSQPRRRWVDCPTHTCDNGGIESWLSIVRWQCAQPELSVSSNLASVTVPGEHDPVWFLSIVFRSEMAFKQTLPTGLASFLQTLRYNLTDEAALVIRALSPSQNKAAWSHIPIEMGINVPMSRAHAANPHTTVPLTKAQCINDVGEIVGKQSTCQMPRIKAIYGGAPKE